MLRTRHSRAMLQWLPALLAAALLVAGCGSKETPVTAPPTEGATEEPVLNFANFIEEISPGTLPAFTRETGIRVNYDTYETNLALESRLVVGSTGLDVVVPGNNFLERQIAADVYQPLDKLRLPNLRHLDPRILAQLEANDPGNVHAVPYLWGTTSFGYNVRMVEAALGGPAPDSWALVFDPRYASRLADCGISAVDSPWLMVGFALMYLGRDPNSESLEDLADAMQVLMAIRPYLREITAMPATSALVNGDVCVAISVSADFRAARDLALETGRDVQIRYVIPKEGATLWIDTLAIPKDAPHPGNAHRLIDYLMRPDVIAEVTKATYLPNANSTANELLPPEIRNDPMIYPDASAMERLHMNAALSDAYTRAQNREFTRFKTGR